MKARARKQPASERKRSIIESAQAVFASEGYANAGTGDVARAAGVAPSALYRYFPSKRDLYLAALRDAGERQLAVFGKTEAKSPNPLEAIRSFGLGYYERSAERSHYASLWFQALGDVSDAEIREALAGNFRAMADHVAGELAEAKARGIARPGLDARIAAWQFMSIGLMFDLLRHLGLGDELDSEKAAAWGDFYIQSLRKESDESEG